MTQHVNVTLSESTYLRLKRWAESRQQKLDEAIVDILSGALGPEGESTVPPSTPDPRVEQEKSAYLRLHPQLRQAYAGQYVAIHDGQLIDHDEDYAALLKRIDDLFPDTFVWLARVEQQPMGSIAFRSPRFVEEGS